ncbi:1,4-dihydroxy-6-naphthoate synthase [Calidithermus chliarophilus]|uniref:1,4-dihydroxy-6-naphthoate synthase n=1 Tax=Calidithermus chliarophilus TaxID=52023 RepID=UPI0012F6D228|nr:1,4-dihydroxy-6-naphthoate synthase [Calidithermus chliarophilus]
MRDYYAKIYVDGDLSYEQLASDLENLFGVEARTRAIDLDKGTIYIEENEDFDARLRSNPEDGFLFYRYILDVEPLVELGQQNALDLVTTLLNHLWSKRIRAVAACGYEDLLPEAPI